MEGKNLVSQGQSGTGRAVIYQDKYDPADGFIKFAQNDQLNKLKKEQARVAKQKILNTKLAEVDVTISDELDKEELMAHRNKGQEAVTNASIAGYDLEDPSSPGGKLLWNTKKELEMDSAISADNKKMSQSMIDEYAKNPDLYDGEEYLKRLEEYQKLGTMRERNNYLKGIGSEDDFGTGLLVPEVDWLDPIEGLKATEYNFLFEDGNVTRGGTKADPDKTLDFVYNRLDTEIGRLAIRKDVGEGKRFEDIDAYAEALRDDLVARANTSSSKTEDEKNEPWTWNFGGGGSGIERNGKFTFIYGDEVLPNYDKTTSGIDGQLFSESTTERPVMNISWNDGQPKVFDFQTKDKEQVNVSMTGVYLDDEGKLIGRGILLKPLPGGGFGTEFETGMAQKGEQIEIPLEVYDNRTRFESVYGNTVGNVKEKMKQVFQGAQKEKDEVITKAVDTGIKDVKAKITRMNVENEPIFLTKGEVTTIENMSGGSYKDGVINVVSGPYAKSYDLKTENGRWLFNDRFGKEEK
jgi:hypothetical protein